MISGSIPQLAILALVTLVGILFTFDGYNLADQLLAWIGWLAGGGSGAALGWVMATNSSGNPDRLLLAGGGLVIGALLGRILVPLVSWLAVVLLGFVSTSAAALFVLSGQQLANKITTLNTSISSPRDVEFLINQLAALPVLQNQQVIALTLIAGLVGALLASQYYSLLITTVVSVIGAALLSVVLPLWEQALTSGFTVSGSALSNISSGVLVLILIAGLVVQGYRYGEELGLPFVGSEYDPLAGQ